MLDELVAVLRHFGELVIDDDTAELLVSMSAATIDRRLAGERAKRQLKGRRATKPGSLLRSQIPVRTWADWDDAKPGFVEIDLVSHDGGNPLGPFAFTLTVTDVATGWTENRSVPSKEAKCVLGALESIANKMPFPILGVDSDNGAEFINVYLFLCAGNARSPSPGATDQQKRRLPRRAEKLDSGPHLCRLPPLRHRSRNVATQRNMAATVPVDQLFLPQQKLVSKVRHSAKLTKKYDTATTPFRRAIDHPTITDDRIASMARNHALINPPPLSVRSRP